MPKTVEKAAIISHQLIGPLVYKLTIKVPVIAAQALPGQFVHLRVADAIDPLLRRPISIASADATLGTLDLIYRVVGRGTSLLAEKSAGDFLDVMGPLGNGFTLNAAKPLLIGGGMGLAPLIYLTQKLCPKPITMIIGGRDSSEMFWQEIFAGACQALHLTTNDGSLGHKGFTVDVLPSILTKGDFDMLYACGPKPMLEEVARLALKHGLPCQISLEDHMACGVGACLSCTCAGNDGKRRKVCTDGPVFAAEEVLTLC